MSTHTDNDASVYTVLMKDGVDPVTPDVWTSHGGKVTVNILEDSSTLQIVVDAGWNDPKSAPYRLALSSGTDYSTLRIVGTGIAWSKQRLRQPTSVPDTETDQPVASSTDSKFVRTETAARLVLRAQATAASRSITTISGAVASVPNRFGERAGAIIHRPEANYRVRTATANSQSVQLEADRHTTIAAHNAATAGLMVAQVNAMWAGRTVRQHVESPLGAV